MKIYKITEASEYLGVSINTLKTLANNGKINSFKTPGKHRRKKGKWTYSIVDEVKIDLINKWNTRRRQYVI